MVEGVKETVKEQVEVQAEDEGMGKDMEDMEEGVVVVEGEVVEEEEIVGVSAAEGEIVGEAGEGQLISSGMYLGLTTPVGPIFWY